MRNKVYIFGLVLLFCISIVSALRIDPGINYDTVGPSGADAGGYNITIGASSLRSCDVVKSPLSTATRVRIYNASYISIASANFVGDLADTNAMLIAGQTYYVMVNGSGAYDSHYDVSPPAIPLPIDNGTILWKNTSVWIAGAAAPYASNNLAFNIDYIDCVMDGQITVINAYTLSPIYNFTVNINNGTDAWNISTNNGTVYYAYNKTVNITVFNINGTNDKYYNGTYINWNSTITLTHYAKYIDTVSPVITQLALSENPFNITANLSFNCTDNNATLLEYYILWNGNQVFYQNVTNGTRQSALVNLTTGSNSAYFRCSDQVNNATSNVSWTAKTITFSLIDEVDATLFDFGNLTSARLYYNETSYINLKATNITQLNYTFANNSRVWFEFSNDYYLTLRYFDLDLFDAGEIRVCANKHTVEEIQNTLISASQTPAKIRNVFSNCYIVGDYTRYAYQDALSLRFFTIDAIYELTTVQDGSQMLLAYIDGGLSTYYNIDTLLFNQNAYNFNIMGSDLTASSYASDTIHIRYYNADRDNTQSALAIYNLNSSVLLYSVVPATPDSWDVYYNYTAAGVNINNNTIFKVIVTESKESGDTTTQVVYVRPNGRSGVLPNGVAFGFSLFILILALGGLSFGVAFSFVGFFLVLGALIILTFAPGGEAITMLTALELVAELFMGIFILHASQGGYYGR